MEEYLHCSITAMLELLSNFTRAPLINQSITINCKIKIYDIVTDYWFILHHYANDARYDTQYQQLRSRCWLSPWCIPGWITVMRCWQVLLPTYITIFSRYLTRRLGWYTVSVFVTISLLKFWESQKGEVHL